MLSFAIAIALVPAALAQTAQVMKPGAAAEDEWQLRQLKKTEDTLKTALDNVRAAMAVRTTRDATPQSGKIVNGALTVLYPAAGALIKIRGGKFSSSCSGTLVGCRTFLTAAHCVADPAVEHYQVYFQNAGLFEVGSIDSHPSYDHSTLNYDVAVLHLAKDVTGIRPMPLRTGLEVPAGTAATIVGFGRSGGENFDYGLKRMGAVTTAACGSDHPIGNFLCWQFDNPLGIPGSNSNTCNGDSGGGLYVGTPAQVAGITSGGALATCLAGDSSYDGSVFRYSGWIRQKAGADLAPAAACGGVATTDSPGVSVVAGADILSAQKPRSLFSLNVPPGAGRLRITLNGFEDLSADIDFNLAANPGAVAAAGGNRCESNGPGQYEACEILNPVAGPWQIAVTRRAGDGQFQVIATIFP